MFDQFFSGIATAFSDRFGGPFVDAEAVWPGVPVKDAGGSIVSPALPVRKPCKTQVCAPSAAMRSDAGFLETDMHLVVLRATLDGALDTFADIEIASGPHAGRWDLQTARLDTAGVAWLCRGRKL